MIQQINTNLMIQTIDPEEKTQAMQLRLVGELTGEGVFLLRRAVEPIFISPTPPTLRLFMKEITYMDSSGVGILIMIIKKMKDMGGKLEIHDLSDVGRELFQILKLASLNDVVSLNKCN